MQPKGCFTILTRPVLWVVGRVLDIVGLRERVVAWGKRETEREREANRAG